MFIITDGLPTQGASPPLVRKTIDGEGRLKLFERALGKYPERVPANVILMPMEGDPSASAAFWALARRTNGAFLMPGEGLAMTMRRRTRDFEVFSMSFLDTITLRVRLDHPAVHAEQVRRTKGPREGEG